MQGSRGARKSALGKKIVREVALGFEKLMKKEEGTSAGICVARAPVTKEPARLPRA